MSFLAEPAAAGIALARTLRINAKLAAFMSSLLVFLVPSFLLHRCPVMY
jgi:hypothetical protein